LPLKDGKKKTNQNKDNMKISAQPVRTLQAQPVLSAHLTGIDCASPGENG
jgi:hypothetical protein